MQKLKSLSDIGALILASCLCSCTMSESALSDTNSSESTKALYARISSLAERGVMFGHQDDMMYGHAWSYEDGRSDVKEACGSYPAVFGWELGGIELGDSLNLDGVPFNTMREGIRKAYAMNAINTVSIHMSNPVTMGNSWDSKSKTTVEQILSDESVKATYSMWLSRVAAFLASIKDDNGDNIPLIFRPLHENSSGAFWWGSIQCTPEQYMQLWKYTVSYLRDTCGLHSLIYMYSTDVVRDEEEFMSRYPGDEWVDMLGIDAYHRQQDWDYKSGCESMLTMLSMVGHEHNKPYAFSETGLEGVPDAKWWTGSLLDAIKDKGLSYVLVWRNSDKMPDHYFGPFKGCVSEDDFREFVSTDSILMLDDIQ